MADDHDDDEGYWMAAGDPAPGTKVKPKASSDLRVVFSRVPTAVYEKLQKVATRDSYSVSMYVARLIIKDMNKKRV